METVRVYGVGIDVKIGLCKNQQVKLKLRTSWQYELYLNGRAKNEYKF